ncbi:MAG: 3-hydroxyacyl-CoA dehydrogenase NAD-binding domain-containing protein [Ketobacteraceae bacterium]|nr:3-hydroxyacyl-CoA dehydrogenase NAD-binding domain-containing protein [Ketobacteraceae bacterium]
MTGQILKALKKRERQMPEQQEQGKGDWQHWQLLKGSKDIQWLVLDQQDSGHNVLSQDVIGELNDILALLEKQPPKGLVIRSAKPAGFCMGADIREFTELSEETEIVNRLQSAHQVANRLEKLDCPKVAVIHGNCLGGGLELALCCDARIALPDAKLGFPEINLGLHPGLGGTARATELMDPLDAMKMMLTGKPMNAGKAKAAGLVDEVVPERHVQNAVVDFLFTRKLDHQHSTKEKLLSTGVARQLEGRQMRKQTAKKVPLTHYPAPEALINLWEDHGNDHDGMLQNEIQSFASLLKTETAQNLIRVFFLREELKGQTRQKDIAPLQRVHVIGAGTMGGDIAAWCAYKGLTVTLADAEPKMIAQAMGNAGKLAGSKDLSPAEQQAMLDRLIPDLDQKGLARADLIIEAVPEKLDIKKDVYDQIQSQMKSDAILATNTSSIPLQKLREVVDDPSRFIGLHFFNPVAKMPLLEVVQHDQLDDSTRQTALKFAGQIDRLPAPVDSQPGFLVNRVLTPYLMEAILMLDEGISAEVIDKAATDFGMPVGPVELADQVGLDICLSVADTLREQLDSNLPQAPAWLKQKLDDNKLGKKTGEGLYEWKDGKPRKKRSVPDAEDEMADRLILPLVNAAMGCYHDKVVESTKVLDGAVIFGTGFAPYTGGPVNYLETRGKQEVRERMQQLADTHGERFTPAWD